MQKQDLSAALSNFTSTAGAQLKYYLFVSLYPELKDVELQKLLGISSSSSYARIKKAVQEMSLNPLEIEQSTIPEATDWETQYNQFADAASQREMALLNEINNLKAANEKAAYDMQGALMKIQYLERELDAANAKIEKLEKSNFDSAAQ